MKFWQGLFGQRFHGVLLIQIMAYALVVLVFVWVTLSKAMVNEDIKKLQALKLEINREKEHLTSLRLQVANLERPERLDRLAREKLGLKPVSPEKQAHLDSLSELSKSVRPVDQNALPAGAPDQASSPLGSTLNDNAGVRPAISNSAVQ